MKQGFYRPLQYHRRQTNYHEDWHWKAFASRISCRSSNTIRRYNCSEREVVWISRFTFRVLQTVYKPTNGRLISEVCLPWNRLEGAVLWSQTTGCETLGVQLFQISQTRSFNADLWHWSGQNEEYPIFWDKAIPPKSPDGRFRFRIKIRRKQSPVNLRCMSE